MSYADHYRDGRVHAARDDVDYGDGEYDRHHKLYNHEFGGCGRRCDHENIFHAVLSVDQRDMREGVKGRIVHCSVIP